MAIGLVSVIFLQTFNDAEEELRANLTFQLSNIVMLADELLKILLSWRGYGQGHVESSRAVNMILLATSVDLQSEVGQLHDLLHQRRFCVPNAVWAVEVSISADHALSAHGPLNLFEAVIADEIDSRPIATELKLGSSDAVGVLHDEEVVSSVRKHSVIDQRVDVE